MTYSVYQHWDPLRVCVVGRSYPPEFYSWITVPHVRKLFERIAIETEEDYQNIIKKLESFGVEVLRPVVFSDLGYYLMPDDSKYIAPPMTPRDSSIMIGNVFFETLTSTRWKTGYEHIIEHVKKQGNAVKKNHISKAPGAYITRLGQDLYFGTETYNQDQIKYREQINAEFTTTRNHIVNTGGHSDATYCPVCPGLIISLADVPTYADTFPGWEVVYLPGQSWSAVQPFLDLKQKNKGKWWIPGFEHDQNVIDVVETWLGHWTGYVEETVFDVNMLIIDPKNVMVFNYNKQVFDALERYGITPHVVPFRHRYFWDGGIHCITSDLHREGAMQDYFPERTNVPQDT
jgi:N-dimethylarginine dimethylaminohydrolase